MINTNNIHSEVGVGSAGYSPKDTGSTTLRMKHDPVERFWSKVKPPVGIGECWEWAASKDGGGYGIIQIKKNGVWMRYKAHRFAYEQVFGKIPEGKQLDHLCRNRGCVNPYHLEPVTNKVNILRGEGITANYARRQTCSKGHPLSGDNLVKSALKYGSREYRICSNEDDRMRYRIKHHGSPEIVGMFMKRDKNGRRMFFIDGKRVTEQKWLELAHPITNCF